MSKNMPQPVEPLAMDVLQQFRLIYGSMRQYFRLVEQRCGIPGAQMWVLQELKRSPGIGVVDLATRLGVHQSTCSQLVEVLVVRGHATKKRQQADRRRVGLFLAASGCELLDRLPGPAEGLLPAALLRLPEFALVTLKANLGELIQQLPSKDDSFAETPLAELLRSGDGGGA